MNIVSMIKYLKYKKGEKNEKYRINNTKIGRIFL